MEPLRIAHITDLHFGITNYTGDDTSLVRMVNAYAADVICVTGDLTQSGEKAQYKQALNFMKCLNAPVLAIQGNHDRAFTKDGEKHFKKIIQPWQKLRNNQYSITKDGRTYSFGTLNSNFKYKQVEHSMRNYGRVAKSEIDSLESQLQGDVNLLLIHHSVVWADAIPLCNSAAVVRFVDRNNISYVLSGHTHTPDYTKTQNLHRKEFWSLNSGTLRSANRRKDTPNSFAIYDISDDIHITHVDVHHN